MEMVDITNWPRRESYEYFSTVSQPFYSVTYTQTVTEIHNFARRRGLSFYFAMVWAVTAAVNRVEAFRMTITPAGPAVLPRRDPSFTVLRPGEESFRILTMEWDPSPERFCAAAAERERRQTAFLDQAGETGNLLYLSCLPWIELTGLTNERDFDPDDAIPRISWGKYRREGENLRLGLSLEVNHRLIDGVHIGQFAAALDEIQRALKES